MPLTAFFVAVFNASNESLLYVLVETPGIVRAVGPDHCGEGSSGWLGTTVEKSFGLDWRTLVELAESRAPFASSVGELRMAPLFGDDTAVSKVLVQVGAAVPPRPSSRPPSASKGPLLLEWVRGRDMGAQRSVELAERLVDTSLPVYIHGENGTGVETLALHLAARRSHQGPLKRHRVGSDNGLFENVTAAEGVLLLEDTHLLDCASGDQLARALTDGVFANWQLIAFGREDLRNKVQRSECSAQLAAQLRSSTVFLPSLRDRQDLQWLVSEMLKGLGTTEFTEFDVTPVAMRTLAAHAWPDNLQELRSVLARESALADKGVIAEVKLPQHHPPQSESPPAGGLRRQAERAALAEALQTSAGNVSVAARKLGVARSTLYRLLERHGLARE